MEVNVQMQKDTGLKLFAESAAQEAIAGDWNAAYANIEVLACEVVSVTRYGSAADMQTAYEHVERAYTAIVTHNGPDNAKMYRVEVGMLAGLMVLLHCATTRRFDAEVGEHVSKSEEGKKILSALTGQPLGLTGNQLADKTGIDEGDLSRIWLPKLRQGGLVGTERIGRTTINTLFSEIGR